MHTATPAGSATTGKVRAASPTRCLLSIDEVEVEVEVEGLQKVRVDALDSEEVSAEVTAEALYSEEPRSPRLVAILWAVAPDSRSMRALPPSVVMGAP